MVELISCLTTAGREAPSAAITASLVVDVDAVFATLGVALRSLARLLIGIDIVAQRRSWGAFWIRWRVRATGRDIATLWDEGDHCAAGGRAWGRRAAAPFFRTRVVWSRCRHCAPGEAKETRARPEAAHRGGAQRRHSPWIRVDNASDGAGDRGRRAHPGGAQHRYFLWGDKPRRRCRKSRRRHTRGEGDARAAGGRALGAARSAAILLDSGGGVSAMAREVAVPRHEGATARGAARSAAFQLAF
ncbi:hypothetical protein BD626DRAFT_635185 [Schizophyllum amplum]|uniref:Uncharacterized protein n=1 Tax=Schizophyllum amplum TaxID=97359 RepID=A0A550BWQ3_9AGAR|nr:hypothetical protein BD626DRAFT_635185 [Auriculariopsis ampla]